MLIFRPLLMDVAESAAPGGAAPPPPAAPLAAPAATSMRDMIRSDLAASATTGQTPAPIASTPEALPAPVAAAPQPPEPSFTDDGDEFRFSDETEEGEAPKPEAAAPKPEAAAAETEAKPAAEPEESAEKALKDALNSADGDAIRKEFLRTNQGRRMLRAHSLVRDLEAPVENGGLGFTGFTKEDVRAWNDSHNWIQGFTTAIGSGDPESVSRAWSDLIGDPNTGYMPGMETAVSQLPRLLAQQSPELYHRMAAPIRADVVDGIANFIRQMPDGDPKSPDPALVEAAAQKEGWIYAAQRIEEFVTGRARNREEFINKDRRISEAEALRQENARLKKQQQDFATQQQQKQFEAYTSSFNELLTSKVESWASEALQPLAAQYGKDSWQFTSAVERLSAEAIDSVVGNPKKNVPGVTHLKISAKAAIQQNWNGGSPDEPFKVLRNPLMNAVRTLRSRYINGSNGTAQPAATNGNLHRAHANAANGSGVAAAGQPVQQSLRPEMPLPERSPGETSREYLKKAILQDLMSPANARRR